MNFSIVICTAHRETILLNTLASIVTIANSAVNIIVVDNNPSGFSNAMSRTILQYANLTIISEPISGLSQARNAGLKATITPWVIFLDDDVEVPEDFFTIADQTIKSNQFDCFGGAYYPFYPEGKPKWLPLDFGQKHTLRSTTGPIDVPKDGFLSAGILAVKKSALEKIGGFSVDFGMSNNLGYGEEDELQLRLQAAGFRIGFVPNWWLYHAVLSHKHTLRWHLKAEYARGRDGQRLHHKWNNISAFYYLMKGAGGLVWRSVKSIFMLITIKNFYWQNAVLITLGPFANILGRFNATIFGMKRV